MALGVNSKPDAPPLVPGSRRGKPGRPKTGEAGIFREPENGHTVGTPTMKPCTQHGDGDGTQAQITVAPVSPRLLDLHTAAGYLGLSQWTVRELEAAGIVPRVRVPLPHAGELRKLLFDRTDLDRLIDSWKDVSR